MINIYQFSIEAIFSKDNIYFIIASTLWAIITIITAKSIKINAFVFTTYTYIISSATLYIFYI